jgi:hypothetical protein
LKENSENIGKDRLSDAKLKMQDKVSKPDTRNISNISIWLQNKLGSSQNGRFTPAQCNCMSSDRFPSAILDLWINGGSSICSQLNKEVLRNIKEVFTDLQTQVKLKLLLSFFHIPRRLIDEVGRLWLVSDGTHSKFTNTSAVFVYRTPTPPRGCIFTECQFISATNSY